MTPLDVLTVTLAFLIISLVSFFLGVVGRLVYAKGSRAYEQAKPRLQLRRPVDNRLT